MSAAPRTAFGTLSNEAMIAVAGMLDLAPAVRVEPPTDQRVVRPNQFERCAVAEARRDLGRTDDVGEHDVAQPRVHDRCDSA